MTLAPGTRLGPYEITAQIGEGGMGEVYRATDTHLKRAVAIKVLPASVAGDRDRLARFQREAEVLAALNHPNIAGIYGLEQGPAEAGHHIRALVMELVEGDDLSQRIARLRASGASAGQAGIPLDEALPIAKQIAEALEAAHEAGIIHRDLKPANIKVRADGTVKVLDFGLAKALDEPKGSSPPGLENSPTITSPAMTQMGMILGTAAYMSPEQAKGRPVDRRTDIFAFGCVLYEMLTGRRAFDGDDVTEVLGAVVRLEPDWTRLPSDCPPAIQRLLRLCLEKNVRNRRSSATDVRLDLEEAARAPQSVTPASTAPPRRARLPWVAACGALALALAVLATVHFGEGPPAAQPEMRVDISTPGTIRPSEFALSPDGGSVVFVAASEGISRLWIRRLDRTDARPLPGTEGARNPFWSPDNSSIAFVANNTLKRIAAGGGPAVALADANHRFGGSWNAKGDILFVGPGGLQRINASGGSPVGVFGAAVAGPFWYPEFGPDGVHFLYQSGIRREGGMAIYLGSLDGTPPKRLGLADSQAAWLAHDRVLYMAQGTLLAQSLDVERGELSGEPEVLADAVGTEFVRGAFSVSANGRIAYRSGGFESQWIRVDRAGEPVGRPFDFGAAEVTSVVLAPDGKRAALDATVQNNRDVWLADLVRGGTTRFTFDAERDGIPVWSPDGQMVAFESARGGDFDLYLKPADGSASETLLTKLPQGQWPQDWSRDGKFLLYFSGRDQSPDEERVMALPMTGTDRASIEVARGLQGKFSPDGRWVAVQTRQSGRSEVVVQAFPVATGKWQVSTAGGESPRWSADGQALYFVADGTLMVAAVRVAGSSLQVATPVRLFDVYDGTSTGGTRPPFDVARDGSFIVNRVSDAALTTPITLLLNWKPK